MPLDSLVDRIGSRFIVVTLMPNIAFAGLLGLLLAAGAPARRPTWHEAVATFQEISWLGFVGLTVAVVVISLALHPLQYPLIQIVEGYWLSLPLGAPLARGATEPVNHEYRRLREIGDSEDNVDPVVAAEAQRRLHWLPDLPELLLPTALGNTLRAGEMRAGSRYNYRTDVVLPRLVSMLTVDMRNQLTDLRNQLDAAVRFCVLGLLAVVITVPLLIAHDVWLLVPLACYLFAWASYRAAVAAARRFCVMLEVIFDLHHLDLWDTLRLESPPNLAEERQRNATLTRLLNGRQLTESEYANFVYARRT